MKLLLLHLFSAFFLLRVNGNVYETEDAIIVEAPTEAKTRAKRDTIAAGRNLGTVTTWGSKMGEGGVCITAEAKYGQCMSFKSCYPYFKKVPDLSIWDTWVLGNYDTCTFFTDDGRQAFGVCCENPPKKPIDNAPTIAAVDSNVIIANKDTVYSDWPPQAPTHPPNHAAPTHPAISGFWPAGVTYFPTTTTKRPLTTTRPSSYPWPPLVSTHPPISVTTPAPVYSDPVGNYCGAKNGNQDQERIVGGQNAIPNEWPWIAALFNNGRQFCGGSLIDKNHILTAAHCIAHMTSLDVSRLTVRLGDHNIRIPTEVQHIEKKVRRVVRHRLFDARTLYNDIAILTIDSPVTYSTTVRPICLPRTDKQFNGMFGTVIGWGSLRENGPQPAVLQKVTIPIWSNAQCRIKYGGAAPGGIVDHMLCAGQNDQDSCSGDSGGPLMINEGNSWYQCGIVSWGIGCGQGRYPGVYTRITSFLPWIEKNIQTV